MNSRRSLVPNIVNLQAFECASRHQNFSRAAEELNLTQSAISRQIAELEQQTGLKLFERIRKRVVLSDAGQRLLPEVKDLLLRSERLMIGAVAAGRASLKIATLPTFGAKWLVPRLGRFLTDRSEIALIVESRSKPFSFAEDDFDLAIHYGQPIWAGGVATFLCREAVLPFAGRNLAQALQVTEACDLSSAPLLHLTTRPKLWTEWFELHEVSADGAYRGSRFDQFAMLAAAAIAGLGVALLPTYLVEDELQAGSLVPLLSKAMTTENSYFVVRPEQKQRHVIADQFEEWLLAEMGADRPA